VRHEKNLGYGGNQKNGYRWAIEHDYDIVVLLHGDGQYAPEVIGELIDPLARSEADAVFGSRMMRRGEARRGGMPLYKYVGNKILTAFQNSVAGLDLTEWHSGYRAYSVAALRELGFDGYSDGFNFDTEIILGLADRRLRITEVAIPTFYGDEVCCVNGLAYARDVVRDVLRHRFSGSGRRASAASVNAVEPAPHLAVDFGYVAD
jgi:glycosyltransferase involved in cell wall biosynthesis